MQCCELGMSLLGRRAEDMASDCRTITAAAPVQVSLALELRLDCGIFEWFRIRDRSAGKNLRRLHVFLLVSCVHTQTTRSQALTAPTGVDVSGRAVGGHFRSKLTSMTEGWCPKVVASCFLTDIVWEPQVSSWSSGGLSRASGSDIRGTTYWRKLNYLLMYPWTIGRPRQAQGYSHRLSGVDDAALLLS